MPAVFPIFLVLFPSLPCAPTPRGEQHLSHLTGWTPGWDGAGFCEMHWVLWQHRCCLWSLPLLSAGWGREQPLQQPAWCRGALLHPGAYGAGEHRAGAGSLVWGSPGQLGESGQLPGIVRCVWEQMCCSSGISAHSCRGLLSFRLLPVPFSPFPSLC